MAGNPVRAGLRLSLLALYCLVLLLIFDFAYSSLFYTDDPRHLHIANAVYDHGLTPNFDGFNFWGENRTHVQTDNLGFKDYAVRDVPLKTDARRILLIGDSFTEAIGVSFDNSFAGRLYHAGQRHKPRVEFLNAGVVSYSPTVYYVKTKYLLDKGLKVDEVVALPDMSDTFDESHSYFCIDPIPEYRAYCRHSRYGSIDKNSWGTWLQKKFIVTDNTRLIVKFELHQWFGNAKQYVLDPSRLDGWALPGWKGGHDFQPLGIEGAMTRATRHMQMLADLLKARGIALRVAVYPYPDIVNHDNLQNGYVEMWRDFCKTNCKEFINLFPAVFAYKKAHPRDWYERLYIYGDIHFNAEGNRVLYDELVKHLL